MERASRLRRYLRKDYSQLVDFPVEIVGRDGLVRRYSFDDSVRLYQRRIHSAPMRYDDSELVDAEVHHCRQRIDQLRRSYLEHFAWADLREGRIGGTLEGPLAAEVVAFLRRAFAAEPEGPASLRLSLLESGDGDTFYVRCASSGRSWILYAWRVDGAGPRGARDASRGELERLAGAPEADGVERLFVASEGPDVVLALAGVGAWAGPRMISGEEDAFPAPEAADPLHLGVRALYDGNAGNALQILEAALDAQPDRPVLAQAAALVALLEGLSERAEFAARFGRLSRPDDPLLAYLLGLALGRAGRLAEAGDVIQAALARAPSSSLPRLLDAYLSLRRGRFLRAWSSASLVVRLEREGRYATRAAGLLRRAVARLVAFAGLATVAMAVALLTAPSTAGLVVVPLSIVLLVAAAVRTVRWGRAALAGATTRGVPRLVSLELLPRERTGEAHH